MSIFVGSGLGIRREAKPLRQHRTTSNYSVKEFQLSMVRRRVIYFFLYIYKYIYMYIVMYKVRATWYKVRLSFCRQVEISPVYFEGFFRNMERCLNWDLNWGFNWGRGCLNWGLTWGLAWGLNWGLDWDRGCLNWGLDSGLNWGSGCWNWGLNWGLNWVASTLCPLRAGEYLRVFAKVSKMNNQVFVCYCYALIVLAGK